MKDKHPERQLSLRFEESTFGVEPQQPSSAQAQVYDLATHRAAITVQAALEEAKREQSLFKRAIDSVRFF